MPGTFTCTCGATFPTQALLSKHAATCGVSRDPGGDPSTQG